MKDFLIAALVCLVGIVVVGGLIGGVETYYDKQEKLKLDRSPFRVGDRVRVKLDGRPGIVVNCYVSDYEGVRIHVRVTTRQMTTDTRLFGPDGPIQMSSYSIVVFGEYELEKEEIHD